MSKNILIYGSGGLGVEVLDLVHRTSNFSSKTPIFVDDFNHGSVVCGTKVISFNEALSKFAGVDIVIANGEPESRYKMFNKAKKAGFNLPVIIDESAHVSNFSQIGEGSIICSKCTLAARSKVGSNVLINVQSIVGHDVNINNNTVLASMVNVGGAATIGKNCMLGMGVTIRPKISIGNNTLVAFSSSVFSDLPADIIAVGNPARASRKK